MNKKTKTPLFHVAKRAALPWYKAMLIRGAAVVLALVFCAIVTMLVTGEIGDDLTEYFMSSEQVPSSVGLGVLMNKDNTVRCAGGFIVQLMPFAPDEVVDRLEQNLKEITSVTALLDSGMTPDDIVKKVLDGFDIEFNDTIPASFYCNCSKDRFAKGLISLSASDMKEMIDAGEPIEVNCRFCGKHYNFSVEELKEIDKLRR